MAVELRGSSKLQMPTLHYWPSCRHPAPSPITQFDYRPTSNQTQRSHLIEGLDFLYFSRHQLPLLFLLILYSIWLFVWECKPSSPFYCCNCHWYCYYYTIPYGDLCALFLEFYLSCGWLVNWLVMFPNHFSDSCCFSGHRRKVKKDNLEVNLLYNCVGVGVLSQPWCLGCFRFACVDVNVDVDILSIITINSCCHRRNCNPDYENLEGRLTF